MAGLNDGEDCCDAWPCLFVADDLYKDGALEKAFPSMYSGVADDVDQAEEVEPQPDAATSG